MAQKQRLSLYFVAAVLLFSAANLFAAPPVADAGPDVTVTDSDNDGRQLVFLDGSRSTDPDNNIDRYIWRDADSGMFIKFGTAPIQSTLLTLGVHHLLLSVSDTDGDGSDEDPINFTVLAGTGTVVNRPPTAAATVPSQVTAATATATVNVNASASSDPDGDPIILYEWHEGLTLLRQSTSAITSFPLTGLGSHQLRLTVHSRDGMSVVKTGTATFTVTVNAVPDAPPVASAVVPSTVTADGSHNAQVSVNANGSSDVDGHPIVRHVWREGLAVLFDGNQAVTGLNLTGLGVHTLTLTVYSNNGVSQVASQPVQYTVNVLELPSNVPFGGRTFVRVQGFDFNFAINDIRENFTGLAYNPISNTHFLLDSVSAEIIEITLGGDDVRIIDISGLSAGGVPDTQAITWMGGNRFALSMEDPAELAVFEISDTATQINRSQAVIYSFPSEATNVEGIAYDHRDGYMYFSNQEGPVKIYKALLNPAEATMSVVREYNLSSALPRADISDLAFFPRLSPHLIVLSKFKVDDDHREPKVYEVVVATNVPGVSPGQVLGEFALNPTQIPQPQGITFGPDGKMYVVTESEPGPEDHYTIFTPSPAMPVNVLPIASAGASMQKVVDNDGNGTELLTFHTAGTRDPDGLIIDYVWRADGAEVSSGFGPSVPSLTHSFAVGLHTVRLQIRDDNRAMVTTDVAVEVIAQGASSNHPPVADATVPAQITTVFANQAPLPVNASASIDPDGDPLTRFVWHDGPTVLSDGANPVATLTLSGEGVHTLVLTVYSIDAEIVTQSSSKNFIVTVSLENHPPVPFPLPPGDTAVSLNYVHPGGAAQQAEFYYELVQTGEAEIFIFDATGRQIKNFLTGTLPPGQYRAPWDLTNDDHAAVASGVYFALIKTPTGTRRDKVVIIR